MLCWKTKCTDTNNDLLDGGILQPNGNQLIVVIELDNVDPVLLRVFASKILSSLEWFCFKKRKPTWSTARSTMIKLHLTSWHQKTCNSCFAGLEPSHVYAIVSSLSLCVRAMFKLYIAHPLSGEGRMVFRDSRRLLTFVLLALSCIFTSFFVAEWLTEAVHRTTQICYHRVQQSHVIVVTQWLSWQTSVRGPCITKVLLIFRQWKGQRYRTPFHKTYMKSGLCIEHYGGGTECIRIMIKRPFVYSIYLPFSGRSRRLLCSRCLNSDQSPSWFLTLLPRGYGFALECLSALYSHRA